MVLFLQILLTLICLSMLVNGVLNRRRIRHDAGIMEHLPLPMELPLISVCVPARNEARNIARCLESLARQEYANYEVLVLDDCSEDGTGEIARRVAAGRSNLRVLTGEPLPAGWIGKPHACRQLGDAARGQWLLFTDADTEFSPQALTRTLRLALVRRADLLTGLPRLPVVSLWERLSVPLLGVIALGGVIFSLAARIPWFWYGGASGAFLFFRREAYEAIGGHNAVKTRIVEDLELGRAVKRARRRLVMTDLTRLVSCRMYTSLGEVWEGFTKNLHAGFPGMLTLLVIAGLLGIFVAPYVWLIFGPIWGWGAWRADALPLVQIASITILKVYVDERINSGGLSGAFLLPLAALFMVVIALRSASRSLLKQPTPWRARQYELWK